MSKKYIRGKRVKNRGSNVSYLLLFPFASLFTFMLENKNTASNNQRSYTKRLQYLFSLNYFSQNISLVPQKTLLGKTPPLSLFFFWLSNTHEPDKQLRQYRLPGIIFKILLLISSNTDKLHTLVVEKTKRERKTQLAMINSKRSFTTPTTNGYKNKKINEISCRILTFALQFTSLPQGKISKIF